MSEEEIIEKCKIKKKPLELLHTIAFNIELMGITCFGDEFRKIEQALQRLEAIDLLQEQLCYPLKILIKVIIDQNVYIPDLKDYRRTTIKNGHIYIKFKRKDYILPFEDYGKTWLLKEDIIKNE